MHNYCCKYTHINKHICKCDSDQMKAIKITSDSPSPTKNNIKTVRFSNVFVGDWSVCYCALHINIHTQMYSTCVICVIWMCNFLSAIVEITEIEFLNSLAYTYTQTHTSCYGMRWVEISIAEISISDNIFGDAIDFFAIFVVVKKKIIFITHIHSQTEQ